MIAHDPKVVQQEEGCEAITDQLYVAVPKNREACPASLDHRISGGRTLLPPPTDRWLDATIIPSLMLSAARIM